MNALLMIRRRNDEMICWHRLEGLEIGDSVSVNIEHSWSWPFFDAEPVQLDLDWADCTAQLVEDGAGMRELTEKVPLPADGHLGCLTYTGQPV